MKSSRSSNLRQTVLSIISSRLQYIKNKQEKLFSKKDDCTGQFVPMQITDEASAAVAFESYLQFEECSRSVRLLMLMRHLLRPRNTSMVFELLIENRYLQFSPEDLRLLLEPKWKQITGSERIAQAG